MGASSFVFSISTLIQLFTSSFCVWYPLKQLGLDFSLRPYNQISLANSNQDIWVLAIINNFILLALFTLDSTTHKPRGSSFRPPLEDRRHVYLGHAVSLTSILFQLLLLAKAVAVAILSKGDPFPKDVDFPGLLYVYISLCTCLLTAFVQAPAARAMQKRWQSMRAERQHSINSSTVDGDVQTSLTQPLLAPASAGNTDKSNGGPVEHHGSSASDSTQATIWALMCLSAPDSPILFLAFSAGALAALGQALIPYYTGRIIDFASIDPNPDAFKQTTVKLLCVAFACAIFTGFRGGLFTISMTRLNVRVRERLFHSLLAQDVGFYDSTKTGEITSRLSADTTTVSDQISLNLNIMLRSTTQAAMVLFFMFSASWRLTVVTFVMVPLVLAICKVYGSYYRKLSKKVQSELAAANSVAEEALSTITTVRAHAAEGSMKAAYSARLQSFYALLQKEAAAYAVSFLFLSCHCWCAINTTLIVLYCIVLFVCHSISSIHLSIQ